MIELWKDPDGDAVDEHPSGQVDLVVAYGGRVAATNGVVTYGCCDVTTGSMAICSSRCTAGWC